MPSRPHGPRGRFPDPRKADAEGLLAVGGDLSPERLVEAYSRGIFPWCEEGSPILWWSPDPRAVFLPGDEHLGSRTLRAIRRAGFEIRMDTAFDAVVEGCATASRPDQEGTWITPAMREAYGNLHRLGLAHSVEAFRDGTLAGGLYGISLGAAFFGESMFSREPYASRAAFAALAETCWQWGFRFIDGQIPNSNLDRLGARVLAREDYLRLLEESLKHPTMRGIWRG